VTVANDDFHQWLEALGLGQYAPAFSDNDVGFDALGHMYVLDRGKNSVVVFGAKNKFVANVTMPEKSTGAFTRAAALAVDPSGRLFIFDERAKRIQVYQ
jgi:predicted RNA polymerase sigma factor